MSGPSTEQPQILAAEREALGRHCPIHGTPPGMPCTVGTTRGICPERIQPPRVDPVLWEFYAGVEAARAAFTAVTAAGGGLVQVERHLVDLGAHRRGHEPGS